MHDKRFAIPVLGSAGIMDRKPNMRATPAARLPEDQSSRGWSIAVFGFGWGNRRGGGNVELLPIWQTSARLDGKSIRSVDQENRRRNQCLGAGASGLLVARRNRR